MNVWKKAVAAGMSGAVILLAAIPSFAGQWQFDGPEQWQWKYMEDDGNCSVNAWKEIDGKWYHFDESGYLDVGGWFKCMETDTYQNEDGSTYTKEETRWYFLGDDGAMATQGEWEGGKIQENGVLLVDEVYFESDNDMVTYWRYVPIRNEAGIITGVQEGDSGHGTVAWKKEFAKQWYNTVWAEGNGEGKMDFKLPENWETECPPPLLEPLVSCPWSGTDYCAWLDWYVDENSVLHVTASRSES